MSAIITKRSEATTVDPDGLIKIAVLAVGGQGGGVLSDWIVDVAERNAFRAQATSVPGVAQRTGATVYYIEMMPDSGRQPVFALMPAPGDVDIVVAAEIMEAGRAMMRGLVTADRTTLISSSHRMFAVSEKIVPGDGRSEAEAVMAAAAEETLGFICFDMEKVAAGVGSHISAALLGALAGSGTLPFPRESFEQTIRDSGLGVSASLRAFAAAFDRASGAIPAEPAGPEKPGAAPVAAPAGPARLLKSWTRLTSRIDGLPGPVRDMAARGLKKVVDFQDVEYGQAYLAELEQAVDRDRTAGGAERGFAFSVSLAKYLANAMCYDDVIRVADLKTRGGRFARVRSDVNADGETLVHITEFMHPRAEEICGMMPVRIGRFVENRPALFRLLDRLFNRGRRIRTDAVAPFLMLYALAGMRRWRRHLLRHAEEETHTRAWLEAGYTQLPSDYALAVEIVACRRLVKGYSCTHSRGLSKFDRVMTGAGLVAGRPDAADWVRRLREAALLDEKGDALSGALETIRSFSSPEPASTV